MNNIQNDKDEDLFESLTKEIEKNFPEKLKKFRKKSGLTTFDVGNALNKTASAVTMWETGKAYPDILTLFKLRKLYKIGDINEFFDETPILGMNALAKTEQELITLWRNSPASVRASIKNILRHIRYELP